MKARATMQLLASLVFSVLVIAGCEISRDNSLSGPAKSRRPNADGAGRQLDIRVCRC